MGNVAVIEVKTGPHLGKRLELRVGETAVVGRGAAAAIRVSDPTVSREHVKIEHREKGIFVVALKPGATLNGRAIASDGVNVKLRGKLVLADLELAISRRFFPELPGITFTEKLGEGEVGEVFAGWQDPPGRRVAVKALFEAADALARKRADREAALQGKLDHPAIVRVHGVIQGPKRRFVVRELIDGRPLEAVVRDAGRLDWRRALEIGAVVAGALAHAHERGVVHRDVKPDNILIETATGAVKLADFDLARPMTNASAEVTRLTASNEGLGHWSYSSPEQIFDAHRAGPKTDVWGLAATLYFALSGVAPFSQLPGDLFLTALQGSGPVPLGQLVPTLPKSVVALVKLGMACEVKDRPDARRFEAEVSRVLRG